MSKRSSSPTINHRILNSSFKIPNFASSIFHLTNAKVYFQITFSIIKDTRSSKILKPKSKFQTFSKFHSVSLESFFQSPPPFESLYIRVSRFRVNSLPHYSRERSLFTSLHCRSPQWVVHEKGVEFHPCLGWNPWIRSDEADLIIARRRYLENSLLVVSIDGSRHG